MQKKWIGLNVEAEGEGISESLSKQVNLLGSLIGHAVREQAGEPMYQIIEGLRSTCKRAYSSDAESLRNEAWKKIEGLEQHQFDWVLRSFTAFFHMVNKAEQQEIIRINKDRERKAELNKPRADSISEAIFMLKEKGLSYQLVLEILGKLDIQPTLTAHPTEARRRTVLRIQSRIAESLSKISSSECTPEEEHEHISELYRQIKLMLNSDDVRSSRLTVEDEVKNGLYFFTNTIWKTLPRIYSDVKSALVRHYGKAPDDIPVFMRYRSWIGGDRDGNPNVTPEVTRYTMQQHRNAIVQLYLDALFEIRSELSLSSRQVEIPDRLMRAISQDYNTISIDAEHEKNYQYEPYRLRICQIMKKLRKAFPLDDTGLLKPNKGTEDSFMYTVDEFLKDLNEMRGCLVEQNFGDLAHNGSLATLIMQVNTFGLSMAALDIRQHSSVFEHTIDELLRNAGVSSNYAQLGEENRIKILSDELKNPRPLIRINTALTPKSQDTVDLFHTIRRTTRIDPQAIGSLIVSMTHDVSDMLEVLILAKEAGLWELQQGKVSTKLDVVPLFETIDDLKNSHFLMAKLFENQVYRMHLDARGRFQEIMLGYSDSNKDGGYWMANWALHVAQENLSRTCRNFNVDFRLFHGRGGSVGRGGGRANQAMLALPPVCHSGRVRFTEQGEVITFRYAHPQIAHRHIEQIVNAMIRATSTGLGYHAESVDKDEVEKATLMNTISSVSMEAYLKLIQHEEFWGWYTSVTPIEHISRLPIASRPVSRKTGSEVDFSSLRAIPWVFAWTQIRHNIPGWYGVGSGLKPLTDNPASCAFLRKLYNEWPFFKVVIDNTQREMARAHFAATPYYQQLSSVTTIPKMIQEEFNITEQAILNITGHDRLLSHNPVIQKSILLRNPYTDVLNMTQAALMHKWKDNQDEALRTLLFTSVNGLAAAMQSTG